MLKLYEVHNMFHFIPLKEIVDLYHENSETDLS